MGIFEVITLIPISTLLLSALVLIMSVITGFLVGSMIIYNLENKPDVLS